MSTTAVIAGVALAVTGSGSGQAGVTAVAATGQGHVELYTVTLLTGDRVSLGSADGRILSVRPGKGRTGTRFAIERTGGSVYVIPLDAQALVRAGALDRRLFDVAGLVKAGYENEKRDSLPLIVQYGSAMSARVTAGAAISTAGARVTRELPAVGGAAVVAKKDDLGRLWTSLTAGGEGRRIASAAGVRRVWLDGRSQVSLDRSVPQIGAPDAWALGYTGRGVTVAVLDTGVDAAHPDLAGRVADSVNFVDGTQLGDTVGHGTHVASIIAGNGAASDGRYKGVAPEATLVSGKVCDVQGCADSAVLAGMQWAAMEKKADVVNLSLGGPDGPGVDPLEEAVNTLSREHGTLFVVAAGNDGQPRTVGSPGSADAALTVGAVDRSDALADFSSQGPRVGDDAVKPDITAPGVWIVAARGTGTAMGTPVHDAYTAASGTSMATPHVAGTAALLAQQHPDWKGDQLKSTLMASAAPTAGLPAYQQGAGRVDAARAAAQAVTSEPASVSYGRQLWPHDDDGPVARTVTYRNTGAGDVTLALALSVTGPGGTVAPAGMFTTSTGTLTVPAGGRAAVTITADMSVNGATGLYSGVLVATAGRERVVTPLGVNKEEESYDLTISYLDQQGSPTQTAFASVAGWDRNVWDWPAVGADGTSIVRLPKGRYNLGAYIDSQQATALLVQPVVDLTRNLVITLDARRAKPVSMSVPEPSAGLGFTDVGYTYHPAYLSYGVGLFLQAYSFDTVRTAQIGDPTTPRDLVGSVTAQWARPDGADDFTDSPYLYATAEAFPGRLPTGFVKHYRARDFAAVHQRFAAGAPGQSAVRMVFPSFTPRIDASALNVPTSLPGTRVEYHNTNQVRWTSELWVGARDGSGWLVPQGRLYQGPTAYQAGQQYRDEWNAGPTGPAFGQVAETAWRWASRTDDKINIGLPLYGDRAGHAGSLSPTDSSRTALYRDGALVGEFPASGEGRFTVPPDVAGYRLEVADTRSGSDLTTKISTVWTFRSGHADGDQPVKLPLSAVRFTPALDANNAAPAGHPFPIPVTVEGQPGAPATTVSQLTVEVSYDDGVTWSKAPLTAGWKCWTATVWHPDGGGFVSLRATATDTAGNTVTQTLIHAYRLTTR